MKSKMWNKIFKNKSSKSSSVTTTPTETNDEDDSNLYDNTHQQQVMIASTSTSSGCNNNHPHNNNNNNTKSSSKLSKMVNSFTLKRNSNKENGINNNNGGYNSDVALSIIRNAELNNEITKFNNYNNNNLNKNVKYMKRQKSIDHCDGDDDDDEILPIMDKTSKLIKTTPPDEIPLSPKLDFNDTNFPISPEPPAQIELHSCPICTRKFVPATLTKHVGICERMATKKRKKFDSYRQRREGTDLAAYLPKNFGITTTANNQSKYKTVIEPKVLSPRIQVQESTPVPAHKQIETGSQNIQSSQKKTTLNPISPTSKQARSKNVVKRLAPVSEQCPHCSRSFGIKAFDRHVDWCKEKSRLQAAKNNADLKTAKDRLEARTKYRAPNLKAKRETIRYKYSGNGDDGQSIDDNRSVDNNIFSMSNSLSSSFMSDGLSLNMENENESYDISNDEDVINFTISSQITSPTSCNIEEILDNDTEDLAIIVDRIEIEEIIPLNSKNILNFDDTPIRPANKVILDKPTNGIPIQPSKTIITDKPSLVLPKICITKTERLKNESPISSTKSSIKEKPLNELVKNINERSKSVIEEKQMSKISASRTKELKNEFSQSTIEVNPVIKSVENLPRSSKIIIEDELLNFDDTPIRPANKVMLDKPTNGIPIQPSKTIITDKPSLVLPKICITKTERLKNESPISSTKSSIKEKPLNELVKNINERSKSVIEEKQMSKISASRTKELKNEFSQSTIEVNPVIKSVENLPRSSKIIIEDELLNFDDTPIRPANKVFLDKPTNEIPMQPSKTIITDKPSLVLPKICITKSERLKNESPISSAKSSIKEKPLNELVKNINERSKSVIEEKQMSKISASQTKELKNEFSQSTIEVNPVMKSVGNLPRFSKIIIEDKPLIDFDEMPIRPAQPVINATTKTAVFKSGLPICLPKSTFKANPLNEFLENFNEPSKTVIGNKPSDNCNENPIVEAKVNKTGIRQTKKTDENNNNSENTIGNPNQTLKSTLADSIDAINIGSNNNDKLPINCEQKDPQNIKPIRIPKVFFNDKPVNEFDEIKIQTSKPILTNTKSINDIEIKLSKDIIKDKCSNDFNEIPIRSSKTIVTEKHKNNFNETQIYSEKAPIKNNTINNINNEVPILPLKRILKDSKKDSIDGINIRASYIDKLSLNLPSISNHINSEPENVTPLRSPKVILKDNPVNLFGEMKIRTPKPILKNRVTMSVNDIPSNPSKDILKDKFANNINQIEEMINGKLLKRINGKSSPLPIIFDKKIEESEVRSTRKLNLNTILPPINRPLQTSLSSDDFDKLLTSSDLINGRRENEASLEFPRKTKKDNKIFLPKVCSQNSLKTSSSNDDSENFWMEISNVGKLVTRKEQQKFIKLNSNEENCNMKSGFSDKYDPFLSAKRQLEELCSPTAETDSPFSTKQQHQATSTPITIKPKLTSSLSTSYTAPSPNPRNTLNTVKSSFRRTSSLRSPRKNNPCHRPLFVPPSRCSRPTTIQRGISDEGPISTNFISTEEYDEMPVKSACINNFATAINSPQFARRDSSPQKLLSRSTSRESSPLVIKRDPNTNLNRRNLRLNLGNNKELNNNSSSNNNPILKTDSLAVFLKYETELTKNPSDKLISSLNQLGNTSTIILPQQISSTAILPVENLISEKDWKDKSNTLSKQNSLKNSSSDLVEKTFVSVEKEKLTLLKNSLTNLLDSNSIGNNNNKLNDTLQKLPPTIASPADVNTSIPSVNKSLPIKLEPLHQNIYKYTATPPPSKTQSPPVVTPSLAPLFPQIKSTPMTVAINNNLINLNSILNIDSKEMDNNNFIDPKLINICDNLQMTSTNTTKTTKESDDSDLTSIGSQDSAYRPKTAPKKFNDDSHSSGHQSSESVIEKSPTPPTTQQRKDQYQCQTSSNRNSTDKRNLLKRQIRLGKNQFLYDASPSDSEPSPDPIINKSQDDLLTSVPSTTIHLPLVESSEKQFDSLLSPSNNPIFNDFDFEEFLSSFEASNDDDDEQFPGFKDCKEFLMNRCLNMRSMNNNFINNNMNINNNTQHSIRSRKIELDPMMMLNDSNYTNKNNNNKRQLCHDDDDDDVQIVHDKREIFISIETDQNENETSNPCPNDPSIQNPKIEEINGNDNKFTKIETYHLPIFEEKDENLTTDFINDVTIQRNNVKNKQQHEDIKETMYPVDSDERSSVECYPIGRRSVKSKASADSAYGSLSRQSPTLTDHSSLRRNSTSRTNRRLPNEQTSDTNVIPTNESKRRNRELSASSSGSENSLPPINNQHHSHHQHQQQQKVLRSYQEESNLPNSKDIFSTTTTLDFGSLPSPSSGQQQQPMSKFCHECGNRFLVTQAKFCMECGVKRIVLK